MDSSSNAAAQWEPKTITIPSVDLDLDPERGSERRDANYPARCCSTVARNGDRSAVGGDLTGTASAAAGGGYTWRSRAKIA